MVSIIVPTLNESSQITQTLISLKKLEGEKEILVVDGGSDDETVSLVQERGIAVVPSNRGRGIQLQVGALHSRDEILWFLHADTVPPAHALKEILGTMSDPSVVGGNFGLTFDGPSRAARRLTAIYPVLR